METAVYAGLSRFHDTLDPSHIHSHQSPLTTRWVGGFTILILVVWGPGETQELSFAAIISVLTSDGPTVFLAFISLIALTISSRVTFPIGPSTTSTSVT